MVIAFIIWSLMALLFIGFGFVAKFSKKPAGFWANTNAPEVSNVGKYNNSVSTLWFVFAILFELIGSPLLFCDKESPLILFVILGTVFLCIGIMVAYTMINLKYKKKIN